LLPAALADGIFLLTRRFAPNNQPGPVGLKFGDGGSGSCCCWFASAHTLHECDTDISFVTYICYKGSLQVAGLLLTRELLDKLGLLVTCRELASAWGKYTVLAAA
jgi:hypothetical protein